MKILQTAQKVLLAAAFFALGAGTLFADDFAGETVPAPAKERLELPGNEGFVRGNGKTVFWKRYKAQDQINLYLESEATETELFSSLFDEDFRKELETDGVPVPAKVKQIALPFRGCKILHLERKNPFISENGNFAFSAKVCGYDFSFEYDAEFGKWRNLPEGDFLAEPDSGEVPETLWLLHVLKNRGALDGISPENYPLFCVCLSSEEIKKGIYAKDIPEIIREREKILRKAVIKEFGEK